MLLMLLYGLLIPFTVIILYNFFHNLLKLPRDKNDTPILHVGGGPAVLRVRRMARSHTNTPRWPASCFLVLDSFRSLPGGLPPAPLPPYFVECS